MYDLKQAARLAYDAFVKNLKQHGYALEKYCPNIWKYKSGDTKCYLWVDDFGVKYTSKEDAMHLIKTLQTNYEITID